VLAESINALVKSNRIAKQLVPITKLAKFFLCFHCFDGAKTVGDCVSSFFAKMDSSLACQSKCCDVEAVVDMLVALESNPETSSRERVKSFALFFSHLRPSLQCHLLLNFESQHGFRLQTIPSWQFFYRDVCAIFSESSNTSPPPLKCMAVDFMNGIQVWLSRLREEAKLRPELQDSVEPNIDALESSSIDSKGFLLERLEELWNTSVDYGTSTTVGSICSISDYEFQKQNFESTYEEVYGTAVVSPNRVQGELKKQHISLVDFCFECCYFLLTDYGMLAVPSLPNEWVRRVPEFDNDAPVPGVDNHAPVPGVDNHAQGIYNTYMLLLLQDLILIFFSLPMDHAIYQDLELSLVLPVSSLLNGRLKGKGCTGIYHLPPSFGKASFFLGKMVNLM
jgi:hypothetical protein